jgi:hypothetical protein
MLGFTEGITVGIDSFGEGNIVGVCVCTIVWNTVGDHVNAVVEGCDVGLADWVKDAGVVCSAVGEAVGLPVFKMGFTRGVAVGELEGFAVGNTVGVHVGTVVDFDVGIDGLVVGAGLLGWSVGKGEGITVSRMDTSEGIADGELYGFMVGNTVGVHVGTGVGHMVGAFVGATVGDHDVWLAVGVRDGAGILGLAVGKEVGNPYSSIGLTEGIAVGV